MKKTTTVRMVVLISIVVFVVLGARLWWRQALSAVDESDTTPHIFVINKGEGVRSIASRLASEGLIRDPIAFFLTIKLLGIDNDIQAGDFRLNPAMDTPSIAKELTLGLLDVWVTTLEGWRVEEIALTLSKELSIPESEFLPFAQEGYMFPDTYLIPRDATGATIAAMFRDNFDKRFTKDLQSQAKKQGLTVHEAVTLASIVEREALHDEDRPIIAGILLKRLDNDWPLDADATVQYAVGYQAKEKSWWKKQLSSSDLAIKSPYNTRLHKGLPPDPISNPGLASLQAVVSPKETEYWFYLSDTKGVNHYATTLEEHNENIRKYLQ